MKSRSEKREEVLEETVSEAPKAGSFKSRIRKQGKPLAGLPSISSGKRGEAGLYEVIHGRINFGYDAASGEAEVALPGAVVELSAEEAARMLDEGIIKKAG